MIRSLEAQAQGDLGGLPRGAARKDRLHRAGAERAAPLLHLAHRGREQCLRLRGAPWVALLV